MSSNHAVCFFLQGNAMFVFGGKYINGDIVEASHTPQMAHGVSQVTNTLSEETPNTHRKSQKKSVKTCWYGKKQAGVYFLAIYFALLDIFILFAYLFTYLPYVFWIQHHHQPPSRYSCDFWETTISRCCVRPRAVCLQLTRGLKTHVPHVFWRWQKSSGQLRQI